MVEYNSFYKEGILLSNSPYYSAMNMRWDDIVAITDIQSIKLRRHYTALAIL